MRRRKMRRARRRRARRALDLAARTWSGTEAYLERLDQPQRATPRRGPRTP